MTDKKRPLTSAFDHLVYAPIGFALEARALMPSLVDRGRRQVDMARMVGRFAVQQGQVMAGQRIAKAQDRADGILGEFGLRPLAEAPITDIDRSTAATPVEEVVGEAVEPEPEPTSPGVDVDSLAINGYDSLAASQVIPRLEGLTAEELELVGRYEAGNRGRKTILGKIAQLRGD